MGTYNSKSIAIGNKLLECFKLTEEAWDSDSLNDIAQPVRDKDGSKAFVIKETSILGQSYYNVISLNRWIAYFSTEKERVFTLNHIIANALDELNKV